MRFFSWIISVMLFLIGIQPIAAVSGSRSAEVDKKVEEILARMTLEEKIGQMVQVVDVNETTRSWLKQSRIGSFLSITDLAQINELQKMALENSRLKIPLIFGFDVIHGFKTIFPIPLAESAGWDPAAAEKAARIAATETRAHGIHWTFAPMVDIARDPRWGRIAEGSGEDPFLGSAMATARIKGFQGTSLSAPDSVVACAKHYAAYGAAEAGRDYNSVDMSERMLREIYLPPFHAAVEAGVGTFMSSFNTLNRIPATANYFLQTQVLRNEWKFDGFVVSDWNSVGELLLHGVAASEAEAAEKAVKAGVDMDMVGNIYVKELTHLVNEGKVPPKTVDEAVRRILRIKVRLGLFENPYADPAKANAVTLTRENLEAARESAQKAMVLLKNENNLLPLSKNLKSLAVIGPLAADRNAPLGSWNGKGSPENVVTILEGIKAKLPGNAEILHVAGCDKRLLPRA
jgi:beta-glucosidase